MRDRQAGNKIWLGGPQMARTGGTNILPEGSPVRGAGGTKSQSGPQMRSSVRRAEGTAIQTEGPPVRNAEGTKIREEGTPVRGSRGTKIWLEGSLVRGTGGTKIGPENGGVEGTEESSFAVWRLRHQWRRGRIREEPAWQAPLISSTQTF